MKRLLSSTILAFTLACPALRAADDPSFRPTADSTAAQSPLAGQYAGKWNGSGDSTGALRIKLARDAAGAWTVESSFTFEGVEIPSKTKSTQIDGAKVELVFEWEIKGTPGRSKLVGELTGDTLKGTFETSGEAGESRGTWTVSRS